MLHLDSLKQCETPLNKLFFSAVNKRNSFKIEGEE